MKKFIASAFIAATTITGGCTFRATPAGVGIDLTTVDFNTLTGLKEGKSCINRFFGFPISRTASIVEAAKSGGISKVRMVDNEVHFGLIRTSSCIVVYGE
jgi:hypothetical protein